MSAHIKQGVSFILKIDVLYLILEINKSIFRMQKFRIFRNILLVLKFIQRIQIYRSK